MGDTRRRLQAESQAEQLRTSKRDQPQENSYDHGSINVTGEANQVGTSCSGWPDIAMDRLAI
jgi:hypothetical protein